MSDTDEAYEKLIALASVPGMQELSVMMCEIIRGIDRLKAENKHLKEVNELLRSMIKEK